MALILKISQKVLSHLYDNYKQYIDGERDPNLEKSFP